MYDTKSNWLFWYAFRLSTLNFFSEMKKLFVTLPSTLWTDGNQWKVSKIREIALSSTIDSLIFTWTLRSSKSQDLPDHISPTFKLEYLLNGYSYQWVSIIFWKFIFHLPLVSCKNLHSGNLLKKSAEWSISSIFEIY